jgi:hypothetical protein
MTEFNGLLQLLARPVCPQNQLVLFLLKGLEGLKSKWSHPSNGRKLVLNDGTIKIDCYYHTVSGVG